jgi:hypothetical protein
MNQVSKSVQATGVMLSERSISHFQADKDEILRLRLRMTLQHILRSEPTRTPE